MGPGGFYVHRELEGTGWRTCYVAYERIARLGSMHAAIDAKTKDTSVSTTHSSSKKARGINHVMSEDCFLSFSVSLFPLGRKIIKGGNVATVHI
jgi:hypothetical protein